MVSRIRLIVLGVAVALGLGLGFQPRPAAAAVEVDIGFFYDRLAPYGHWFKHHRYGHVWYPIGVEFGWRPYTHGHWVWTREYGWYWDSDYEWGWGPFHYGRWVFDDDYGWVWVPGRVWGPAWVLWRWGHGYVGWAPMPPAVLWIVGFGLRFDRFDPDSDFFGRSWIFVEDRHFLAPRLHERVLTGALNVTIRPRTRYMTNYAAIEGRVVNQGVTVEEVERATRSRVPRVVIQDVDRPALILRERDGDTRVPVFRPRVKPEAQAAPAAPPDDRRRKAAGQAILEDTEAAERERLTQRQNIERERAGIDRQQIDKRHDVERRSLRQQQEQLRTQLRNRQKEWPQYPFADQHQ